MLTNQSLFDFSVEEYTFVFDSNINDFNVTTKNFEYEHCTRQDFDFPEYVLEDLNAELSLCLIDDDYRIKGSLVSDTSHYLNITVSKCKDKSHCLSESQIDDVINSNDLKFYLGFQTYYVDSNDYDNPLKPYFDTNLDWYLSPGLQKSMNLNVQFNTFTDNNNIIGFGNEREYEFYSAKSVRDDYKIEDNTHQLLNIILRMDAETIKFARNTYTLLDVIADIGGFIELVNFAFYYVVSIFSIKRFMSFIYRQMYFKDQSNEKISNDFNRVHTTANNSTKLSGRADYVNADLSITDVDAAYNLDNI